jgi:hypothetical protein
MPRAATKNTRQSVSGWLGYQLWNTSLPWLLGFFFVGTGFYYITNNTLALHSKALDDLQRTISVTVNENRAERDRMREQFLVESKATALGMAELNKTTAVMSSTMAEVQKSIDRLTRKLEEQKR